MKNILKYAVLSAALFLSASFTRAVEGPETPQIPDEESLSMTDWDSWVSLAEAMDWVMADALQHGENPEIARDQALSLSALTSGQVAVISPTPVVTSTFSSNSWYRMIDIIGPIATVSPNLGNYIAFNVSSSGSSGIN